MGNGSNDDFWLVHRREQVPKGVLAVAYPIFTLILKIAPPIARNFAFAIQSIGMTSATLLIIGMRLKVDWNYIIFVTIGGVVGLFLGTYYVVPYISAIQAKLFFVSLYLSFGVALWMQNRRPQREVFESIQNFQNSDKRKINYIWISRRGHFIHFWNWY